MTLRYCCALVAAAFLIAASAAAQTPTAPVADQSPVLFVVNSRNAKLQADKLTLEGVSPRAIVFATRPSRNIRQIATPDMVELWRTGSFATNPPNATISVFEKDGSGISDAVVILAGASLTGDTLVFDVALVNGNLAGAEGPASVFIDTVWFQDGRYIGDSKTTGGNTPAIGSPSGTSTFKGWSNPAPDRSNAPPPVTRQQGSGAAAPPPPTYYDPAPSVPSPVPNRCGPPYFPPCPGPS
jgi:hypothetical protein